MISKLKYLIKLNFAHYIIIKWNYGNPSSVVDIKIKTPMVYFTHQMIVSFLVFLSWMVLSFVAVLINMLLELFIDMSLKDTSLHITGNFLGIMLLLYLVNAISSYRNSVKQTNLNELTRQFNSL